MPSRVEFHPAQRLVEVIIAPPVTAAEMIAGIQQVADLTAGDAGIGVVVDFRESDYVPSLADIRGFLSLGDGSRAIRRNRHAIVVRGTLHYGVARMFGTHAEIEGGEVQVFEDIDEARAWLREGAPPGA
jgi:hypothetical protein